MMVVRGCEERREAAERKEKALFFRSPRKPQKPTVALNPVSGLYYHIQEYRYWVHAAPIWHHPPSVRLYVSGHPSLFARRRAGPSCVVVVIQGSSIKPTANSTPTTTSEKR